MTYSLFIDDERMPPAGREWIVARSSFEAIDTVKEMGLPGYISFDHDLGGEDLDTSMRFLHWLIACMLENDVKFPDGFDYYVHSQKPIGKANIEGLLNSYMRAVEPGR